MLTKSTTASVLFAVALAALAGCSSQGGEGDASASTATDTAAVTAGAAAAADAPAAALPEKTQLKAKVDRVLLSPMGGIDGLLLEGGSVVRLPPSAMKADAVARGDVLDIEAFSPPGADSARVLFGATVKKGDVVVAEAKLGPRGPRGHRGPPPGVDAPEAGDHAGRARPPRPEHARGDGPMGMGPMGMGPMGHHPHREHKELATVSSSGVVTALLKAHEGRVDTVLLDDGTTGRLSPRAAELGVAVGDRIKLDGHGTKTEAGTGLFIESVTLASGETKVIDQAPPRPEKIEKSAQIRRAIVNPMGDVDMLLLGDDTLVRLRPDATTAKLTAGQSIKVTGRGHGALVFGEKIASSAGETLYEAPTTPPTPPAERPKLGDVEANATITSVVKNPRGDAELLILSDGTTVMLHGKLAQQASAGLVEGAKIQVRGKGGRYASGTSMFATSITLPSGETFTQPERAPRGMAL